MSLTPRIDEIEASLQKNIIINGNFEVAQRGASGSVGSLTRTLDRWICHQAGFSTANWSQSSNVPNNQSSYSLRYETTGTAAPGATSNAQIWYPIEGYDIQTLTQGSAVVSFWVRSNKTGQYYVSMRSGGLDASYIRGFTINSADTWERKTIEIDQFNTGLGTWDFTNGLGLRIGITLDCGPNFYTTSEGIWEAGNYICKSDQTDFFGASGNYIEVSQFMCHAGTTASPTFHRAGRTFQDELAMCQRYFYRWQKTSTGGNDPAAFMIGAISTVRALGVMHLPVPMRDSPIFSFGTALSDFSVSPGAITPTSISLRASGVCTAEMDINVAAGLTTAGAYRFSDTNGNAYMDFNAETAV